MSDYDAATTVFYPHCQLWLHLKAGNEKQAGKSDRINQINYI